MGAFDDARLRRYQRFGYPDRMRVRDRAQRLLERLSIRNRYRAEHFYCHSNLHRGQRDKRWPNPYWANR